jgi:acetyl-CoA decarbonylase/synthase complex subunit delta
MTQQPMICFIGEESWRQKESRATEGVPEEWGAFEKRGITWETVTAAALLESGADIVVLRHPKTVSTVRDTIDRLMAH